MTDKEALWFADILIKTTTLRGSASIIEGKLIVAFLNRAVGAEAYKLVRLSKEGHRDHFRVVAIRNHRSSRPQSGITWKDL